jgi:hypothetical protein
MQVIVPIKARLLQQKYSYGENGGVAYSFCVRTRPQKASARSSGHRECLHQIQTWSIRIGRLYCRPAFGEDVTLDPVSAATPGLSHRLGAPAFPVINYTVDYEEDLVAREIKKSGFPKIGIVAPNSMLAGF